MGSGGVPSKARVDLLRESRTKSTSVPNDPGDSHQIYGNWMLQSITNTTSLHPPLKKSTSLRPLLRPRVFWKKHEAWLSMLQQKCCDIRGVFRGAKELSLKSWPMTKLTKLFGSCLGRRRWSPLAAADTNTRRCDRSLVRSRSKGLRCHMFLFMFQDHPTIWVSWPTLHCYLGSTGHPEDGPGLYSSSEPKPIES